MESSYEYHSVRKRAEERGQEREVYSYSAAKSRFTVVYPEPNSGDRRYLPSNQSNRPSHQSYNFLQVSPVFFKPVSGRPAELVPPSQSREHLTSASNPAQRQELMYLYEKLRHSEFRAVLIQSLPRLAVHIMDDAVFLNLDSLPFLPIEDSEEGYDSDSSWSQHQKTSGRRAAGTLLRDFFAALGARSGLTSMAFIIGLFFVHVYRKCCHSNEANDTIKSSYHLLIIGTMLANKYTEDRPHSNASWARMTGFTVEVINRMESCFLRVIGHRIFVEEADFKKWVLCLSRLLDWVPRHQRMLWGPSPYVTASFVPVITSQQRPANPPSGAWWNASRFSRFMSRKNSQDDHQHDIKPG